MPGLGGQSMQHGTETLRLAVRKNHDAHAVLAQHLTPVLRYRLAREQVGLKRLAYRFKVLGRAGK